VRSRLMKMLRFGRMNVQLAVVMLAGAVCAAVVGEVACRSAPPQTAALVQEGGFVSDAAAAAAAAAAVVAATRVLAIVGDDVNGEETFGGILVDLRSRGFDVTLKSASEKINMPLEEYGHLLLLSDCTFSPCACPCNLIGDWRASQRRSCFVCAYRSRMLNTGARTHTHPHPEIHRDRSANSPCTVFS